IALGGVAEVDNLPRVNVKAFPQWQTSQEGVEVWAVRPRIAKADRVGVQVVVDANHQGPTRETHAVGRRRFPDGGLWLGLGRSFRWILGRSLYRLLGRDLHRLPGRSRHRVLGWSGVNGRLLTSRLTPTVRRLGLLARPPGVVNRRLLLVRVGLLRRGFALE